MTFLGLEQPVAYGRELVFDPTTALMVLNANRDYINAVYRDYQLAMADMKEFNKEYGNFLSPFARDMERYNQIVGGIQNGIEDLYNRGIDPLRSSEGRAFVTRMINSVNPAELAAMKSNAKLGYAYLDAMQALRKAGKYSQAQEDFDIAYNGDTAFDDFATGNGSGGFNTWKRTSPIEATTLRDLTYDSYKGRTARDLTIEDFKTDPRLRNYTYDPRYQYSGYLDSDLMKVAPGASASLAADPRAAFFRDQARQKVIASGKEPTAEAVEAQFQRDIADANAWALIDPTKRADDFAKLDLEHQYRMAEINLRGSGGSGSGSGGDSDGPGVYDWAEDIYDKGLNAIAGLPGGQAYQLGPGSWVGAQEYYQGGTELVNAQRSFGKDVALRYKTSDYSSRYSAYRNRYTHTKGISGKTFAEYLGRPVYENTANNKIEWKGLGTVRINDDDLKRMRTVDLMITNTAGYTAKYRTGNTDVIDKVKENPQNYVMGGNNIDIYGAFDKPGQYRNDFIVNIYERTSGKKIGEIAYDSYIDSEKTSTGFYQKNGNSKANTSRNLTTRQSVTEGSRRVNHSLSLTNKEKMADILPYVGY